VVDQPRPLQVTTSVLAFISTSLRRSTLPRSLDSSSSTSSWSNSRRMLPAGASRSMAMSSPASPTEISAVLSADQPVERHVAFGKWHSNHPNLWGRHDLFGQVNLWILRSGPRPRSQAAGSSPFLPSASARASATMAVRCSGTGMLRKLPANSRSIRCWGDGTKRPAVCNPSKK
jgi:hypothetical protein